MNIYQRKINELEQEFIKLSEENKSLFEEEQELVEKIETDNDILNRLLNRYSRLIKKMRVINTDEEKMFLEYLKMIIKTQGYAAGFWTIIHILAVPFLINGFSDFSEQIRDILSYYLEFYIDNMKDLFSFFIPLTSVSVLALNKGEISTKIKLRLGKIDLEDLELTAYNSKEQIKVTKEKIAKYEQRLEVVENTIHKNQMKEALLRKEQSELIKEKNEIYSQLISSYLEQAVEEDLNKIYSEKHQNQQLYKQPNETIKSN